MFVCFCLRVFKKSTEYLQSLKKGLRALLVISGVEKPPLHQIRIKFLSRTSYSKPQRSEVIPPNHPFPAQIPGTPHHNRNTNQNHHPRLGQNSIFLHSILTSFEENSGGFLILSSVLYLQWQPGSCLHPQTHAALKSC